MGRLNKTRVKLGRLEKVIKQMDKKYSIKVGIIGEHAMEKHPDSDLTNAQLGAIHEFGATIHTTEKMRGYFWHKYGIHKSNKDVIIPTRSFLRMPLLSSQGKQAVIKDVVESLEIGSAVKSDKSVPEEFKGVYERTIINTINPKTLATAIGAAAYKRVMEAFETNGFGNWKPTSEWSKQNRKYNPENNTLVDSGDLQNSITFDVKEV